MQKVHYCSIPYLDYFIEDTWLGTAIKTISDFQSQEQGTCQKFNKKCSITRRGLSNAAKKLAKYLYLPHQKSWNKVLRCWSKLNNLRVIHSCVFNYSVGNIFLTNLFKIFRWYVEAVMCRFFEYLSIKSSF